jgi:hypothetical protein
VTACSLCAGETLGADDPLDGGQLARLTALGASGAARLTLSECLDECERGDVVVARPSVEARRGAAGRGAARPVWFERLAGDVLTTDLTGWLDAGGPGVVDLPASLAPHVLVRDPAADD